MPADTTIRIRGIAATTTSEDFLKRVRQLVSQPFSLASQENYKVATVTFASTALKGQAQRDLILAIDDHWVIDDAFWGLTVLHSPDNADIE
jgi:hypothetical protein